MSGEAISPRQILDYLSLGEKLKCATRHCFTTSGRQESVAEHSFQLGLLCMLLWDSCPGVEMERVLQMCILHDMGEAFTGDIPAFEKGADHREREAALLSAWVESLPEPQRSGFRELYEEMDALETQEAKIYKAMDRLEAIIQHNEAPLESWLPLEYALQFTYGKKDLEFSPYFQALRREIDEISREKIRSGGGEIPPEGRA